MAKKLNARTSRVRRVHRAYLNLRRTRQILTVFLKYGFDDILQRLKVEYLFKIRQKIRPRPVQEEMVQLHPAARLRLAFGELGPTFIKLGQILSTRPDLIPPAYAKEFGKLRDEAPPLSPEVVEQQIQEHLKQPIRELFPEFQTEPVASASISQVHRAKLPSGETVAVKIQRPNIRRTVESDLEILRDLAQLLTRYLPEVALYNPIGIVDEFDKSIHREMDFIREARNIERFQRNFADNPFLVLPGVHWPFTTDSILTMDYISGKKFSELMEEAIPPELVDHIVEHGSDILLKQLFEHGFFHADPHPGNILLLPDRRLAFLDFGMMGNLDEQLREDLGELLYGVIKKDLTIVIRKLQALTTFPEEIDLRSLRIDLADFIERYYNLPIGKINFERLLNDLLEISHRHQISFPADLILMFRALMISESIVRALYPDFNLVEKAKPIIKGLALHKYDPGKKMKQFLTFLEDSEDLIRSFPREMKAILQKVKQGDIKVKFQHQNLDDLVTELELTSTRLSFSLIIAAIIVGSSLIIHSNHGPFLFGYPILGLIGFLLAGIMGIWLVINILRSGKLR